MAFVSTSFIVGIDIIAAAGFLIAVALSLLSYKKTMGESNMWLIISMLFTFILIVNVSNVLEWASITSALDQAEDFLIILAFLGWGYAVHEMK